MGLRVVSCGNLYTDRKWLSNIGVRVRPRITIKHKARPELGSYRDYLVPSGPEGKHYVNDTIAQLEVTASVRNARAFENILESINWENRSASEFNRVIDLALRMGAYTSARRISRMGQARYPQDDRIRKYYTILAEPVVTQRAVPFNPSIRANRDWLKAHRDEYRGKWIGLQNGNLLSSADSIDELIASIGEGRGVLITRVP
jgi:hypothetical protein